MSKLFEVEIKFCLLWRRRSRSIAGYARCTRAHFRAVAQFKVQQHYSSTESMYENRPHPNKRHTLPSLSRVTLPTDYWTFRKPNNATGNNNNYVLLLHIRIIVILYFTK